jgi:hypothetical protein
MRGVTSVLAALLLVAAGAEAQITSVSVNKCLQRKLLEVRKTAAADMQCHVVFRTLADAERYSSCKTRVERKFTGGDDPSRGRFEKIEARFPPGACLTYDDQEPMFYVEIWEHLTTLLSFTIPGIPNACDTEKRKCARKYIAGSMQCYAAAARPHDGGLVSPSCLADAASALIGTPASCLDRIDATYGGACSGGSVNSPVIHEIIDLFARKAVCRADPGNPACPTPTPTPHIPTRTATPTGTRTPTPTPTPIPTSTVPGVCGDGLVGYGEFCDPPGAGPCGEDFACTDCNCACPSTLDFAFDAASPDTALDLGGTGFGHLQPLTTDGGLTFTVGGCAGTTRPCGVCALGGPVLSADADAGKVHNRRCTDDTSIKCADDTPCLGGGGTCEFFLGSHLPVSAAGVGACLVSQMNGPVTGTTNLESGAFTAEVALVTRVYSRVAPSLADEPCPRCLGDGPPNDGITDGTCDAGARGGLACDANGTVPGRPDFGSPSLDCPPDPGLLVASLPLRFASLTTGVTSKILTSGSPTCSGSTAPPEKCFCDTCNNANAEPCSSNADCPMSGGSPGICGGRRCFGGSNAGGPCGGGGGGASACPGGSCGRLGEPTIPSTCLDDTYGPGFCTDESPAGGGRTQCAMTRFGGGPLDETCSNHPQRICFSDADCDHVSGACGSPAVRHCFAGDGDVGAAIIAAGKAVPPVGDVASPTVAAISCVGATGSPHLNASHGLPGPARITLQGTMTAHP